MMRVDGVDLHYRYIERPEKILDKGGNRKVE